MKESYTGKKRTSIALDPDLTKRIEKLLKNSGRKLSKYTQEAIKKELDKDETDKAIKKLDKLMGSAGYHKIKQLENDITKLKNQNNAFEDYIKITDNMGTRLDKLDRKIDKDYKTTQNEIHSHIKATQEVIKILKMAKKNPIIRKELEKQ